MTILGLALAAIVIASPARGSTYLAFQEWGGQWCDAEKSPLTAEDDHLCWAASAANVLDWTGWGGMANFNSADRIFAEYRDHWTDAGGLMSYAWRWWFDGLDRAPRVTGWSHVDVPGGAFVDRQFNFDDYYHRTALDQLAMSAIDEYVHSGCGVALVISQPTRSHTLTCWGYDYDEGGYRGIWVTDSDDNRSMADAPDVLRYFDVAARDGRWYLRGHNGGDSWYINEVQALSRPPVAVAAQVPEPGCLAWFSLTWLMLARRRR
jgi:hypothetical protein